MGTREVYEEKLRTGNMYDYDPTMKPGLGSPRCPRCLSLLNPTSDRGEWTITSVLHDATVVVAELCFDEYSYSKCSNMQLKVELHMEVLLDKAGSGIGGLLTAIHGFNSGIPYVQKHVKGPKWLRFVVGIPPFLTYSTAGAAFGGYALPEFTQLTVTSYYAASSASSYCISLLTRQIEEAHASRPQHERLR
ncbi:hypothetical protein M9H77_12021 [Catharanthus roseus]|uniref:Uncharacterized protein n=1 Tax=Catharanthus roseus TaxID=4058 RepID=A0ACC0BGA3_CATRO|nr:hypothetical protein M9H77_12021 [Catharanthus roseus]